MTLGNEDHPVVVIGKQESKFKWETWIKDNKVVANEDGGHISCDLASTRI